VDFVASLLLGEDGTCVNLMLKRSKRIFIQAQVVCVYFTHINNLLHTNTLLHKLHKDTHTWLSQVRSRAYFYYTHRCAKHRRASLHKPRS
jgi:hypothetical protein